MEDRTLDKLVAARTRARASVTDRTFQPFASFITPDLLDPGGILGEIPADQSSGSLAVAQQGVDFLAATRRALDMRAMTHKDYIRAHDRSRAGQAASEQLRVAAYREGRF